MDWLEVLQRIAAGESEHTEFKRGVDRDKAGPAVAAFANTEGGLLIFGVDDDGTIVGVNRSPETVAEELTNFLQNGLSAPVQARLGRYEDQGRWVHWIEVARQRGFEPLKHSGRVYVRRSRSSVQPAPAELQELYNVFGYVLTEERAIGDSKVGDIDEQRFGEFLKNQGIDLDEEPKLPLERDLIARGVMTELGGEAKASLYGWLAFGRRPQSAAQTRSFCIQYAVYDGEDRASRSLESGECSGRLDEQVERALGWLRGFPRRELYGEVHRKDVPFLPEVAAREAIVNAVAHRDYAILGSKILIDVFSDRVEVTSPGTLPNHMTPDSVTRGAHPRSRNELIANFFLARGLMEGRGRGWPLMRKSMRQHSGKDPILEEDRGGSFVRVTLPLTKPATPAEDEP